MEPSGTDQRFAFTHAGRTYQLTSWRHWPVAIAVEMERGSVSALAELFAPGEFDQLCDDGFTLGQLTDVIDAANAHANEAKEAAEAEARKGAPRRPVLPWARAKAEDA